MKARLGWVLLSLFLLGMAALCVRLGVWQLDRLEQRRARNAAVLAAGALPPLPLDAAAAARLGAAPDSFVHRRATATGAWIAGRDFVLRGRAQDGRPGVHVVTPLRTEGGVLLVLRGFLPSPDASTVGRVPPPGAGAGSVAGLLQRVPETDDRGQPSGGDGTRPLTLRRLDRGEVQRRLGAEVLPLYLQLVPGGAAPAPPLAPVPPPVPDEGNHLSYAVQWFGFATIAVAGWAVLLLRRRRPDPR